MQDAILAEKIKSHSPDIYVHPEITDVPLLAFGEATRVFRQSAPAIKEMKKQIEEMLV
jgi:hypothetical protein